MKKVILAIFLAVIAMAQVHAQDSDLRSAPDLPTFKVTLTVDNGTGGTLYEGSAALTNGATQYAYGTKKTITLVADKGKTLSSFLAGSDAKLPTVIWGEGSYPSQNTYTYDLTLDKETTFKAVWADKKKVTVTVSGTEQIVNGEKAAEVTVSTDEEGLNLVPGYYKDEKCTAEATDADRKKVGTYYVKLSAPETAAYLSVDTVVKLTVVDKTGLKVSVLPTSAEVLLQDALLSTAKLTGGQVVSAKDNNTVVQGAWSWTKLDTKLEAGAHEYSATFIPTDQSVYARVSEDIEVKAKYSTSVTVTQTIGGKVEIVTQAVDGKYIGSVEGVATLEVKATPEAGYRFKSWNNGIANPTEGAGSEKSVIRMDIPATDGSQISAVFEKAERGLTVTNDKGGNLYVGDKQLSSGNNPFEHGTDITITLVADPQKMLNSLSVNGVVQTLTPVFSTSGTYANRNVYTYALGKLVATATIVSQWKDKPVVEVTVSGTEQIVNPEKAAVVTVKTNVEGLTLTPVYYKDEKCTAEATDADRKKVGTYYVKLSAPETATYQAVDKIELLKVTAKKPLQIRSQALKCELPMLQGQMLSAVTIPDSAVYEFEKDQRIPGSWKWKNPGVELKAGSNSYAAVYMPEDSMTYIPLETTVEVSAKHVTSVSTIQALGGVVAIENATADNKYIGTIEGYATIKVKAIPNAGYKFVGWWDNSGTSSEEEVTKEVLATDGLIVSAKFEKATRKIEISSSGSGKGTVTVNGKASGYMAEVGGTANIVATPDGNSVVKSIEYQLSSATPSIGSSFIVGGNASDSYKVTVVFDPKPADKKLIKVGELSNGSIRLEFNGNVIAANSSVAEGTTVSVIAVPDKGYELKSLTQDGQEVTGGTIKVTKDTEVAATFKAKTYPLTVDTPEGVKFSVREGTVTFGDKLKPSVEVTDPDHYKLLSLIVNNKPVENDTEITVEGPVQITAQVRKLVGLSLISLSDSAVYDGNEKAFVARTANGLAGFSYKYRKESSSDWKTEAPKSAGTYDVQISRPADDLYAAFMDVATLLIKPALPKVARIPFLADFKEDKLEVDDGTWYKGILRSSGNNIYFVPKDPNQKSVNVVTVADDQVKEVKATLSNESLFGTATLKIGDLPVENLTSSLREGQTITVEASPIAGYRVDWSKITLSAGQLDGNHSFDLSADVTVTIGANAFIAKNDPEAAEKTLSATYTGKIQEVALSKLALTPNDTKWRISYRQNGSPAVPLSVGEYDIYVSRDEDETYKAGEIKAGTLKIGKATINSSNVKVPAATAIRKGDALSLSQLEGGQVKVEDNLVIGSFSWTTPAAPIDKAGLQSIKFTPQDANYEMADNVNLTASVTLLDVPVRTMTLISVNTGSVNITDATGASLASGAKVPEGTQLTISVKSGTITEVKVGDDKLKAREDGTYIYTVGDKDFTITITYATDPTPGPDDIRVTGVSLDATSKTLAVGESFALQAKVTPNNATMKTVSWSSSDETVATVDANGVVTALKIGTCKITVSTDDGNKTASCAVTVSGTVGIEQIADGMRAYGIRGAVVIEPTTPVSVRIIAMTGTCVYSGNVTDISRIPAPAGTYLIELSANGHHATTKVSVR